MILQCAWCEKNYGETQPAGEGVSYGLCPGCIAGITPALARLVAAPPPAPGAPEEGREEPPAS